MESASEHRINDERLEEKIRQFDGGFPAPLNACAESLPCAGNA